MFRLKCGSRNYAWGKKGTSSEVGALLAADSLEVDEETRYAELWMGTHVNCPSVVSSSTPPSPLDEVIAADPEKMLGDAVDVANGRLPFLFKVLSVATALSIQAHPDKALAEALHAASPEIYKDDNHKPEMAIALTPVSVLCGFRPHAQIRAFLSSLPPLMDVIGPESDAARYLDGHDDALKDVFAAVMKAQPDVVAPAVQALVHALEAQDAAESDIGLAVGTELQTLIPTLNQQYPDDVGILCVFFLNVIRLAPGEAVFLGPNQPHAYLSGDIVEAMATSDNVVRAGLTPKLRDVDTLISMLTYQTGTPHDQMNVPVAQGDHWLVYTTPVPEFDVARLAAPPGPSSIPPLNGPSILLTVQGSATVTASSSVDASRVLSTGSVYFLAPNTQLDLNIDSDIVLFRAYCTP